MTTSFTAFHFGLVQDVAVLRPLVRLAAGQATVDLHLLVSKNFASLDTDGRWTCEIQRLASEVGVAPFIYESAFDVLRQVGSGRGIIIAGSESDSRAHRDAHELFQSMPGRIRTITLQHGFECVGFVHNARHDATAGRDVRFAADIAVAWFEQDQLHSVSASQRSKIYVAGPPTMLEHSKASSEVASGAMPLICENLHSVRFVNGRMRETFLDTFLAFAERLRMVGQKLALRPHPAGRFTERKGVPLPENVEVSREPLYDLDLHRFEYIISAPSTVLFDFALAGIPVATWVDEEGVVDASNFSGLARVATLEDWWRFHWLAQWEREKLVERQDRFVAALAVQPNVRDRYLQLLALA